jgi:DNA repair protein RadA/Sms
MEEQRKPGRPRLSQPMVPQIPSIIEFSEVMKLNQLEIDPRMLNTMVSGLPLDELISYEGGVPCATNIMVAGDPGVGKTTLMLDLVASIQNKKEYKCLFISGEMGKKQMFKYTQRFPQFGIVETLFMTDYIQYNSKDVVEQILNKGYDLVLIDSIAEILDNARDDNRWDRKTAESWLVDLCVKHNLGENINGKFTSFLLIQQVTKAGEFAGSNKLKHLVDAMCEVRLDKESSETYLMFSKNRNGHANIRFSYQLTNTSIYYGRIIKEDTESEMEITNPEEIDEDVVVNCC